MSYTVLWKPSATNRLAEIWTNAPDRNAVTMAAHVIDDMLRVDPMGAGESRSGETRILIVPPLAVIYEVQDQDRFVHVLAVRRLPN